MMFLSARENKQKEELQVFQEARKATQIIHTLVIIYFNVLFFKSQNLKILKILTLDLIFYSPLVISYLSLTQRYRGKLLWEPHFLCELVEIGGRICSGGQDEYKGRGWWRVLEHQTQIRSLSNKVTSYNILKWLWLYHLCKKKGKRKDYQNILEWNIQW